MPATIFVNSTADVPLTALAPGQVTLRDAIQIANTNGDATNTIDLTVAGDYQIKLAGTPGETDNLAGEFSIFNNALATQTGLSLTIQNTSGGTAIIDANQLSRVFDINANNAVPANNAVLGAVTINGVTIQNGLAQPGDAAGGTGGGIRDIGPVDLTLNNDIVTNNNASADGGGISMENVASTKWALTLNATTVSYNHAGDAGGGVEEDGTGKVFINAGTTIIGNTCVNQGAGIWLDAVAGGTANLTITGAYIAGNTAGMLGGGVGNAGNGAVSIINSTLQDNTSTGFGGGFADQNNLGTLSVQNSLFLGNKAGTNGGGIQEGNGTTITNSEFKNNVAGVNGMMPIGSTTGKPAPIQGSGGGLFINGGTLTLTSSTIADNTAEINGGGIELQTTGATAITNSTIAYNTALFNTPSPSVFLNDGGGIDDDATGTVALVDDTITNNYANRGGGLFFAGTTGLTLQNTIVAQNTVANVGPDVDFTGVGLTGVDQGGNLIGVADQGGDGVFTNAATQTGTLGNPLNPLVSGLSNNGGPLVGSTGHQITLETEALLSGSPAIGKGVSNGVTTDERGFTRLTPPSVGAFEFNASAVTATSATPAANPVTPAAAGNVTLVVTSTVDSPTQVGTLRNAIQQANAAFVNGTATSVTISIQTAGTYQTTLPGANGEIDNLAGEFAIFNNDALIAQTGLNLTIQNDSGGSVVISGANHNRVFDINPFNLVPVNNGVLGAVTITGVTIENGLAQSGDGNGGSGGGIRDQGPVDLTLNNDIITNSNATADGGGVSMENGFSTKWALTLNATTVSDNHAGDAGGGVEEDGTGKVFINAGSVITDNTCINQGAGVWLDAVAGGTANLTITGAYIAGNTAGMLGGGVGNAGNGAVSIINSTLQDNTSTGFGGGFADQNNLGTLSVQNSYFIGNKAGTNGGGIQEGNGTTITNSEFKYNVAGVNGMMPIGTTGGAPNTVMGSGGGLFINGGTLTLNSNTIADNTAEINGGGIELETTGTAIITNTTIAGNTALFNTPSTLTTPSVFLNDGGGIDDAATGTVALIDDTITNNFANNGGGLFFAGTTGLTIQDTLIAQNIASAVGPDVDFTGVGITGFDLGGNLIGIAGAGSGNTFVTTATTQTGTLANPLNPLVTGLTDNGGPLLGSTGHQITLETEALLPGSPAIGKGVTSGVLIDERGFPRLTPQSVGAFEFANTTLTVTVTPASSTLNLNASENVTVTITNTGANALPLDNSTVDVTLTAGGTTITQFTATLGALAVGQGQNFTVTVNGTALGQQTITGTVTSPDTNPTTATGSATVTVTQTTTTTTTTTTPQGTLSIFAFGFGPTGIDLFDVDSVGHVFAVPILSAAGAEFVNTMVQLPLVVFSNGQLLAFLTGANGQNFLIDIVNPFNSFVFGPVLAGLHI